MAISESEAIEYMQLYKLRLQGSVGDLSSDIEAFDKAIEALEKSKRPKGKWLTPYGSYNYRLTTYKCSLCECETDYRSNYCPLCGADMRG